MPSFTFYAPFRVIFYSLVGTWQNQPVYQMWNASDYPNLNIRLYQKLSVLVHHCNFLLKDDMQRFFTNLIKSSF